MTNPWLERWNNRYSQSEYAFGIEPNLYFKEQLSKLPTGKILFAAEGEGRNAVFAAKHGWQASAFDISIEGKNKAMQLAKANDVVIDYQVGELPSLHYQPDQFDAIVLIYAHFPAAIKSQYHQMLASYLRKGGVIIFEAFGKKHLDYVLRDDKIGGPKDIDSLFSIEELQADFQNFKFIELHELEIELHEGLYHNGRGSVVRCVAQKL